MVTVYVPAVSAGTVMVIDPALSTTNTAAVESMVTAEVPVNPEPVMVNEPPEGLTVAGLDVSAGATGHKRATGLGAGLSALPASGNMPQHETLPPSSPQAPNGVVSKSVTLVLGKSAVEATRAAPAPAGWFAPAPRVRLDPQQ